MRDLTIILIRHGLTAYNAAGRYMGRGIDEPLSPEGIEQIIKRRDALRMITEGATAFSGSMKRAYGTAELIFGDDITVIDELTEIDFGDFEGKSAAELSGDIRYKKWIESDGTLKFPNGESIEKFRERSLKGLHNMIEHSEDSRKLAVVCHGGNIMAIMSGLCKGAYYDYLIPNLDGYILNMKAGDEGLSDITYDRIGGGNMP